MARSRSAVRVGLALLVRSDGRVAGPRAAYSDSDRWSPLALKRSRTGLRAYAIGGSWRDRKRPLRASDRREWMVQPS